MEIDIIDTFKEFEKLESAWCEVFAADPEAQFFLSWEWLAQSFAQRANAWCVVAVKPSVGHDYVAFFPLRQGVRYSQNQERFFHVVHMAGSFSWADYTGFICHPDYEEAIAALGAAVKTLRWRSLYLKNINASAARLERFLSQFDASAFQHDNRSRKSDKDGIDLLVSPYVNLPANFDDFLTAQLSAGTRQKVRRMLRKVENSKDLRITESAPENYSRDIDAIIGFWKQRWTERKGKNIDQLAQQYREILERGAAARSLYIPVIWQGDRPIGGLASFIDWQKKTLLFFVAGRDETYKGLPSGLVLHAHSIRWAIDNGFKTYDFLRGNESYKYSLGASDRQIKYIVISKRHPDARDSMLDSKQRNYVFSQANSAYKSGDSRQAEVGYRQLLEGTPNAAAVLRRYGALLTEDSRFAEAKKVYCRLVASDTASAGSWGRLGKSQMALLEYQDAESSFQRAVELSAGKTIIAHFYLASALCKQGKHAEAQVEFHAATQLLPRNTVENQQRNLAREYLAAQN